MCCPEVIIHPHRKLLDGGLGGLLAIRTEDLPSCPYIRDRAGSSSGEHGWITSQPSENPAAAGLDELKELYRRKKKKDFENKTQNYHTPHKFSSPKEQADTLHAHPQLTLHWLSSGTMSVHTQQGYTNIKWHKDTQASTLSSINAEFCK